MIDDFVKRVRDELEARRKSYVDKLVAASSTEHDKLAGNIKGLDEALNALRTQANRFLVDEEAA